MNQDQVKEKLLELHKCAEDFTVMFSGKKSVRVNGFYRVDERKIIIHNRNFENNENGENLLFYTAMHELAHHIQFTELHQKGVRAHTALFFAALDDLAEIAEKKGVYKTPVDEEAQKLIDEAKDVISGIAARQRKLEQVLLQLHVVCELKGIRCDDVIRRKVQLPRRAEKKAMKARGLNLSGAEKNPYLLFTPAAWKC